MISICQHCDLVLKVDLKTKGKLSHGICRDCNADYLRSQNLFTEDKIQEFLKELDEKEKAK